ncbi:DUF2382 domain-containing protein [Rathayibacter iranicus]|uniref:DUF2382 domain-containing protein n=2 Tax=Rathayibacter iranicus TaxID=59737 RepID=A0AAD1EM03_9MICO|nr:PRC and DUF2382 domain-containing protein [Rathayibacter iranicus]AZZ55513.1 DUF2382 domain-containing protein [Rathayibacter iranicus]MWV31655.1 DUF2382 domain-containing protein [Rathayibacter iranicus NCPPB 2253 = VKM Ac-1602]PPI48302.1 photosystem reaction center subunit H [Rathayibacter iranicus]PPI60933.1 photosystem reaction center subunit H [Rathayibacter iranicus]PPI72538.1 photosystem reaction center subunit H [Rathayibacter iranicus]
MIDSSIINDLIGAEVRGSDDTKIGTVGQIYIDNDTQQPSWVTVRTGLFGSSESFAPLSDASFEGGVVRLAYEKTFVKDAPRSADDGELRADEEQALYSYYGNGDGDDRPARTEQPLYDQDADRTADAVGTEGYDTSGPTTDDAMTRSEERLHVGTERVEAGRARLRKHIVTEQVTTTVPVRHEEVVVTREPITDANAGDALAGPDLSEEEHEVVLSAERIVTAKETVPVERVALGTETVTEQRTVSEDIAHEEIELIDPTTAPSTAPHRSR